MTGLNYQPAFHSHVNCDACNKNTAVVWYRKASQDDTLAFCGHHASAHEMPLVEAGYIIIKDFRPKDALELRRKLLEPAPTLEEILLFERLKEPGSIF